MNDIALGIGLVLVIEGLLWALAPHLARRVLEMVSTTSEAELRIGGWMAVAAGLAVVWMVRG